MGGLQGLCVPYFLFPIIFEAPQNAAAIRHDQAALHENDGGDGLVRRPLRLDAQRCDEALLVAARGEELDARVPLSVRDQLRVEEVLDRDWPVLGHLQPPRADVPLEVIEIDRTVLLLRLVKTALRHLRGGAEGLWKLRPDPRWACTRAPASSASSVLRQT